MDVKQLCGIRDINSSAALYYVIVLQIRERSSIDALFITLTQVTTVTNHNKKIIDTGRLYKNTVTEK